mmetsp:Transcript_49496/g.121528  ORF Transcript_49496/g.121528 Transcript_49496/m.121528 type:complete len:238 (-) Transcript_49496:135-848(-)
MRTALSFESVLPPMPTEHAFTSRCSTRRRDGSMISYSSAPSIVCSSSMRSFCSAPRCFSLTTLTMSSILAIAERITSSCALLAALPPPGAAAASFSECLMISRNSSGYLHTRCMGLTRYEMRSRPRVSLRSWQYERNDSKRRLAARSSATASIAFDWCAQNTAYILRKSAICRKISPTRSRPPGSRMRLTISVFTMSSCSQLEKMSSTFAAPFLPSIDGSLRSGLMYTSTTTPRSYV